MNAFFYLVPIQDSGLQIILTPDNYKCLNYRIFGNNLGSYVRFISKTVAPLLNARIMLTKQVISNRPRSQPRLSRVTRLKSLP